MKKHIFMLLSVLTAIVVHGQIYNNFMEAGKWAAADRNYPLALYFYDTAESMMPKDSIVDIYIINARLRDAHNQVGNHDRAIERGKKCISILKDWGFTDKPELMEDYAYVAEIYSRKKDIDNTRCYIDSAFQIAMKPGLNMAYQKKMATLAGLVYSKLGAWPEAEEMHGLAVRFSRRYPPSDDTQMTLNLYGNALFHNDDYEVALSTYEQQRDLCERLFGRDSRQYQWGNYCVANMLAYLGDVRQGAFLYKDVMEWYRNRIVQDMKSMPALERDAYLSNMIELVQNAIPFGVAADFNEDEFTKIAYDQLLLSKGLLLAAEKSAETIIREYGSAEEIKNLETLKKLNIRLTELLADRNSDPKDVLNTYAEIKNLDVKLANAYASYGDNMSFSAIGYEDVRSGLKDDEVLLDFADFKPKSKSRQYVCYEIRHNQKFPKVHYICNGEQLDSLLHLEKGQLGNLYTGEAAETMRDMIGKRLKGIIGDVATVYYVPSGFFHKLAIEAIPDGEGCMVDNHSFRRLSSARELVAQRKGTRLDTARLYGGLDYAEDISPLPKSLQEIKDISKSLEGKVAKDMLTGKEGTKESVLDLNCASPSILHFSTHGYYYAPENPNVPASLEGYNDAMALSGLVMSEGSMLSKSGLLKASDVAGCNFSNTGLTTLAACHSGQGKVTSEGIYGLQRAFKKAGVETIVMNLWQVSDTAAKCFMTTFYDDLMNGSHDRRKAFENAREEVRRQYPSPYYWAGFVMID